MIKRRTIVTKTSQYEHETEARKQVAVFLGAKSGAINKIAKKTPLPGWAFYELKKTGRLEIKIGNETIVYEVIEEALDVTSEG